ncbi:MAG: family 10 glycosylhydrolase [Chitinophagaceae bacterium]
MPSSFEPWSKDLTGTQGTAPSPYYDPLQFMITETRKKGMEFHAWMNPYRALASATTSSINALSSTHVINAHPSWILDCTTNSNGAVQKILNPGLPRSLGLCDKCSNGCSEKI